MSTPGIFTGHGLRGGGSFRALHSTVTRWPSHDAHRELSGIFGRVKHVAHIEITVSFVPDIVPTGSEDGAEVVVGDHPGVGEDGCQQCKRFIVTSFVSNYARRRRYVAIAIRTLFFGYRGIY